MDTPAIVVSAVIGLAVGWFVVARAAETIPEDLPLDPRAKVTTAVVNAALWGFAADHFTRGLVAFTYFIVFSALLAVSVVDLRLFRIPDRIVFPALAVTLVLVLVTSFVIAPDNSIAFDFVKRALLGMVTYFLILFLFHMISPRGMGFGDVKLALLMGLALGWVAASLFEAAYFVLIAIFLSCILGIVFGLAIRVIKGRGGAFPFGPALALATVYIVLVA